MSEYQFTNGVNRKFLEVKSPRIAVIICVYIEWTRDVSIKLLILTDRWNFLEKNAYNPKPIQNYMQRPYDYLFSF